MLTYKTKDRLLRLRKAGLFLILCKCSRLQKNLSESSLNSVYQADKSIRCHFITVNEHSYFMPCYSDIRRAGQLSVIQSVPIP